MTAHGRRRPALVAVAAAVAAVALVGGVTAVPVRAQSEPTTTSSSTSTSTTVAPTTTTTRPATTTTTKQTTTTTPPPTAPTTAPPETVPPAPVGPPAPEPVDTKIDDGAEEPPPRIAVPARTTPRIVTPVDEAVAKVLAEQLKAAQAAANGALAASQAADLVLAGLEEEQRKMQRTFESLSSGEAAAALRLATQRQSMRTRAVAIYVSGPGEPVIPVGTDIQEYGRRRVLVQALHAADRRALDRYIEAKDAAGGDVNGIVDALEDLNGKVIAARADSEAKAAAVQNGLRGVGTAAGPVAIGGFAFPVAEPHNFISSFGFPRSGGRLHQGNDIFSPYGNPVLASERGVISNLGTNSLGGIKLWISGESGTSYYYAHMSAYALGMANGTLVEPGTVVGYVGTSGNAMGTPPHLHFEIHPGGGDAIDPFPILKAADEATKALAAQQPAPLLVPPTLPGPATAAAIP